MLENFGKSYAGRAKRLREQLAMLQPIPTYEESFQDPEMEAATEAMVLPSRQNFMKVNSLNST